MRALSFKLSGKTACFKKPDVNEYAYFTYNNIHKPALLGLLGAVIGLDGHTQLLNKNRYLKLKDDGYPEFYEKLCHLKVSITPLTSKGYFSKKIQTFNNSVGYASYEAGGNLIVREQWLENPSWQIMILEYESEPYKKIEKYLLEGRVVFIPYLGKNDHPAQICEVEIIDLTNPVYNYVDSLFVKNFDILGGYEKEGELPFIFQEISPISLQKEYHFYEYAALIFTNLELENIPDNTYGYDGKNYAFI
ncbi:MAG: type I-B CRISPR-associated protein Cas5b [Campylobacteraceae bacterium]|jgi:CRISPR-associated protein Cas5h|nr:type I-B CRISPR-associated protein Cas5b [Campylobacteraceae bacterium]